MQIRKASLSLLGGWIALLSLCSCCFWGARGERRFDHTFDIGDGRTVRIWSSRRDLWDWDPDPDPLMIRYRIDRGQTELAHTTFMAHDDGGEYRFEVLLADGGRLACVYEVSRYVENSDLVVLYDAASGESWPRNHGGHLGDPPDKNKKWRERFERIRRAHPGFTIPRYLAQE